jgi:two-component system, LytTR family, response regulator
MSLLTLIVDDEPIARKILREELEQLNNLQIVGELDNGQSALEYLEHHPVDLVFLDLQMPGTGGFEVVRRIKLGSHIPVVVIVTAYDEYAVQAFEAGAIDYLLKPVRQDRLAQSVERARRLAHNASEAAGNLLKLQEVATPASSRTRKIIGRAGEEYVLLNTDEVFAFQAEGDLVWIITAKKKYLATQNLRALQEKLQTSNFRRIHRNALVNIDHVRKMSALSSQRWLITLNNNLEFIVSKRQAHSVRDLLSW